MGKVVFVNCEVHHGFKLFYRLVSVALNVAIDQYKWFIVAAFYQPSLLSSSVSRDSFND